MRPIKFRAWDPKRKRMFTGDQIEVRDHIKVVLSYGELHIFRHVQSQDEWEELIPIEWTGLTDKNGTPIYEGDILKDEERIGLWAVAYHNGRFEAVAISDEEPAVQICHTPRRASIRGIRLPISWGDKVEVIGNIHQHPELLTPKES